MTVRRRRRDSPDAPQPTAGPRTLRLPVLVGQRPSDWPVEGARLQKKGFFDSRVDAPICSLAWGVPEVPCKDTQLPSWQGLVRHLLARAALGSRADHGSRTKQDLGMGVGPP